MRLIGSLGGGSNFVAGINDAGQAVGYSLTVPGRWNSQIYHAFITTSDVIPPHTVGIVSARDLGTLGGINSFAQDINAIGQVVGMSVTAEGAHHAFITGEDGIGMKDLGTLGGDFSTAEGINAAGQVVGESTTAEGITHAFVTGPNGVGMMDLNSMLDLPGGIVLSRAIDINNRGQVLAVANLPELASAVTSIPEPETHALMLAGLSIIIVVARRRRTENACAPNCLSNQYANFDRVGMIDLNIKVALPHGIVY